MRRPVLLVLGLLAPFAASFASTGCAHSAFEVSRESRRAAEEREALHGVGAEACEALRVQADRDYERYEEQSRIGWGCGANAPDQKCPSPR